MTTRVLRIGAHALLVCVPALSLLFCSGSASSCGNESEIWFNEVIDGPTCADCVDFTFSSSTFLADTFRVRPQPDYRVARCVVDQVYVFSDGVRLVLSSDVYETLTRFRESLTSRSKGIAVLIRLEGAAGSPVGVIRAEQLRLSLNIFFLKDPAKVDQFVKDLGPSEEAVSSIDLPAAEDRREHPALTRAKKLLEEFENRE